MEPQIEPSQYQSLEYGGARLRLLLLNAQIAVQTPSWQNPDKAQRVLECDTMKAHGGLGRHLPRNPQWLRLAYPRLRIWIKNPIATCRDCSGATRATKANPW